MRTFKLSAIVFAFACIMLVGGCEEEMQTQSDEQQIKIDKLQAELNASNLQLEQTKEKLVSAEQKVTAQEKDLAKKQDMIAKMQQSGSEAAPDKEVSFNTEIEKVSYVVGTEMAQNFIKNDYGLDFDLVVLGIREVVAGKELAVDANEAKQLRTAFVQKMRQKRAADQAELAAKNLAEGKAFLEENKTREGVQVLPSGLQYKVITQGSGKKPALNNKVKTHYKGTLLDGTEFDSSYKRNQPMEIAVNRVIKGWTEALQLMETGSKWQLFVPAELAYGERGRPGIPPNSVLIFEIELLEVIKAEEKAADQTKVIPKARTRKTQN